MSWKAMEVSMSKTRRGKYTDNRICHIRQVQGRHAPLIYEEKANSLVLVTLCEGNHFRFIEERYSKNIETCKDFQIFIFTISTDIQPIKRNLTHLQIKPFQYHTFQANSAHDGR